MNHCRTSYMVVRRERRRPSLASRMIGPLVVLLAVAVWPTAVLAADATTQSPSNAVVVFVVVLLLLVSVATALFFASPFRKRLTSSTADQEEVSAAVDTPARRSVYSPLIPATTSPVQQAPSYPTRVERLVPTQLAQAERVSPLRLAPTQPAPVQVSPAQPLSPQAWIPAPPPPIQPPPTVPVRPAGSPWSTGSPQPDSNWPPKRPGR